MINATEMMGDKMTNGIKEGRKRLRNKNEQELTPRKTIAMHALRYHNQMTRYA
jgi:hypothetical protein